VKELVDSEAILSAIALGIKVAHDNPVPDNTHDADRYAAWCATQELRRAGWIIRQNSS